MNRYSFLSSIAILTVPLAPVFFFGWQVHTEVLATSQSLWLSIPVGLLSAIGLEIIGILAGHLAMEFWRSGNMQRAYLSGAVMLVYVVIGVWELWGTIGAVMFIIAPLVYVLVALQDVATLERHDATIAAKRSDVIGYRERKEQADREQQFKLEKLRLDADVKRAKVAGATIPQPVLVAPVAPQVAELTEAQQRILDAFKAQPNATITEIAGQLGVTRQAVSKQVKQMNGVLHEVRL